MARESSLFSSYKLHVIFRLLTRVVHILTSGLLLTVLILEYFFDFEKNYTVQEDQNYQRIVSASGLLLIGSGVMLKSQM